MAKMKRIMDNGYVAPMEIVDEARTMDDLKKDDSGREYLLRFKSVVALIDEPNGNKRVFTTKLYKDRIFENDDCKSRLKSGRVTGQLGHPDQEETPKEEKITHVFDVLTPEERSAKQFAVAEGRVVDTFYGRIVYGLHKAGVTLGFSVRGLGGSKVKDGIEYVDEADFYLEGYDCVINPAVVEAFPDAVKDVQEREMDFAKQFKDDNMREVAKAVYDQLKADMEISVEDKGEVKDGLGNQGSPDQGTIDTIKAKFQGSTFLKTFDGFREYVKSHYPGLVMYLEMMWGVTDDQKGSEETIEDELEEDEEQGSGKDENYVDVISGLTQDNYEMKKKFDEVKKKLFEVNASYKQLIRQGFIKEKLLKENIEAGVKMVELMDGLESELKEAKENIETLEAKLGTQDSQIQNKDTEIKKVRDHSTRIRRTLRVRSSEMDSRIPPLEEENDKLKIQVKIKDALLELPASKRKIAGTLLQDVTTEEEVEQIVENVKEGKIDPTVFDAIRSSTAKEDENLTGFLLSRTLKQ